MGPWGPKMGVPPKKAPILRKMPFRFMGYVLPCSQRAPGTHITTRPHDDVVVVVKW